jgi:hypothetical protein
MSAIIAQDVKLDVVKQDEAEKFIFIASRAFTGDEKKLLEQFGKLVIYDSTIQILMIDEIFAEKKCDFLYFSINSQDDRKYLSAHFQSLKEYHVVFLKKESEDYDAPWISQFKVEDAIIIKYITPCVRKCQLISFLLTYHKVHAPMGFFRKLVKYLFHL